MKNVDFSTFMICIPHIFMSIYRYGGAITGDMNNKITCRQCDDGSTSEHATNIIKDIHIQLSRYDDMESKKERKRMMKKMGKWKCVMWKS